MSPKKIFFFVFYLGLFSFSNAQTIIKGRSEAHPYQLKKSDFTTEDTDQIIIEDKIPQVWAVIVGVSDYKNDNITDLKYADKDAKDFYNFLKSPNGGSVSEEHIALLTNEQATRANIIGKLQTIFRMALDEDMVIFYIASHAQPDASNEELFFLSSDASSDNVDGTAVSQLDIEKEFRRTKAKKRLWIADACHSGSVGSMGLQVRGEQASMTNRLLTQLGNAQNSMAMFTASTSREYSFEDAKWGGGHGVFTHFIIEGLKGKADKDNNGLVTIRELYEYAYGEVAKATGNKQHPDLNGSYDDKLPLGVTKK